MIVSLRDSISFYLLDSMSYSGQMTHISIPGRGAFNPLVNCNCSDRMEGIEDLDWLVDFVEKGRLRVLLSALKRPL
jgi:hypothetical protein